MLRIPVRAKPPISAISTEIVACAVELHVAQDKHVERPGQPLGEIDMAELLGKDYASRFDAFELAQLSYVVKVCRESKTMADAAKKLFAVSRLSKKSSNDTDRLSKYLARFGLKFKELQDLPEQASQQ